ncbi:MAG: hypothetical protein MJ204_06095 [Bacteroidales bacterium]|nr:hypothetical protein [Bacteroidales bacterium]
MYLTGDLYGDSITPFRMTYSKQILACFSLLFCLSAQAQKAHFSGGYSYSVYTCNNKTVQTWGDNYYGQLARATTKTVQNTPEITDNLDNIVSIDAGLGNFCCAVTSAGNVLAWGYNFDGELGNGIECPGVSIPDTVLGGETSTKYLENVQAISVGQTHTYALLTTGEVVAWGSNAYGQLGDGTTQDKNTPVYVRKNASERLTNIQMIAAGGTHGYALTNEGTVYSWGDNQADQLGCGDSDSHSYPTLINDKNGKPIQNITAIDGGMFFGILLRNDKLVYGVGAYKGTHLDKSGSHYKTTKYADLILGGETPNEYLSNVIAISAGYSHAMAITQERNGKFVVAWGDNRFSDLSQNSGGQLGIGKENVTQYFTPVYMRRNSTTKVQKVQNISAGCGVSYIETDTEFLVCGCNSDGQLGFGDYTDRTYATKLQNTCTNYCGGYQLEAEKNLCAPINNNLTIPFNQNSFEFKWYENDSLTAFIDNNIQIERKGIYSVEIIDKTNDCPTRKTAITIHEKDAGYQKLYTSFCGKEITYKVIGDGKFTWYNKENGYKIGEGSTFTIDKSRCEQIIADSIYQVWVEYNNNCQAMPIQSIQKCDCDIKAPQTFDYESCYNRETAVQAIGDSIVWYADSLLKYPLQLYSPFKQTYNRQGFFSIYATQIKNNCESEASKTNVLLSYCDPWYRISGTVFGTHNNPVENVTVYFVSDEKAIDSCITDSNGEFSMLSQQCVGTIIAKAPSSAYSDTWAGNKENPNDAYQFIVDADIQHITITLISTATDIAEIRKSILTNAIKISQYSLNGTLEKTINGEENCIFPPSYSTAKILVIQYNNGARKTYLLPPTK